MFVESDHAFFHVVYWRNGAFPLPVSVFLTDQVWDPLLLTIRAQIEKYEVTTIVTTSEFAEVLLLLLRDDPTAMTTLSAIILVMTGGRCERRTTLGSPKPPSKSQSCFRSVSSRAPIS